MNFYQIMALFNAVGSGASCIITLFNKNRSKVSNSFLLFNFSVFVWALYYFLWQICTNETEALYWCRALMAGAAFIPSTFFHFSVRFVGKFQKYLNFVRINYLGSFLLLFFDFTPLFVKDVSPRFFFPYWPVPGPLMILHILMFVFLNAYGIFIFREYYLKLSGAKRKQARYLSWGIGIGFAGGFTNYPLWYNIPILPVGNGLVVLFTLVFTHLVLKYRIFDFEVIIKKSLVYSSMITIITIVYFIFIYLTEKFFQQLLGYSSIFPSVATATFIALLFIPIKNFIQSYVDRYFFKGSYVQIAEQNELLTKKLAQSERYKILGTLTNGISHEVKNPLSVIKVGTHNLMKKYVDNEYIRNIAQLIDKETDKITDLIVQLSEYSKPTPIISQEINLHKFLETVIDSYNEDYVLHSINIFKNFNKNEKIIIHADADQLGRAISNIIKNAIEAMPNGGPLWFDTDQHEDMIEISIKDFGKGVHPQQIHDIFDPFYT
ncbi:MAG: hypothetical protein H6755_08005, partial [Candidatus Omnitrophica bacterium]|nr:hypothetical protein [Candidatus Omnitrophota bacterium]